MLNRPKKNVLRQYCCLMVIFIAGMFAIIGSGGGSGSSGNLFSYPPSTPDNLVASMISATQIYLTWDASSDDETVAGYRIFRDGTDVAAVSGIDYTDDNLITDTRYCYTVRSYDNDGNLSGHSNEACATPVDYYSLNKRVVETELPSKITILFHVEDQNGNPVTDLVNEDFIVQEDDVSLSPTEHFQAISKREKLPYSLLTIVLLDISASMNSDDLDSMKSAAKSLIVDPDTGKSRLLAQQKIAIYTFDDEVSPYFPFTNDTEELVAAIDGISSGNPSTNLYGSIRDCLIGERRWEDVYNNAHIFQGFLIVITDGTDTAGVHTKNDVLNAREEKQVFTIGLGDEIDSQALSDIGNAGSYTIDDYSGLETKLHEISSRIETAADSLYSLHYLSPKRDGDHTVTVRVAENGNSGDTARLDGTFNADAFTSNITPEIMVTGDSRVAPGEEISLVATTLWTNTPPDYRWESSNDSVISVTVNLLDQSQGVVFGKVQGAASAQVTDDVNGVQAEHEVAVADILISGTNNVDTGEETSLAAQTLSPEGQPDYSWLVADTNIATLQSSTGETVTVTGKAYGVTTVTVTDNTKGVSQDMSLSVSDIRVSSSELIKAVDDSTNLTATHNSGSNPPSFQWSVDRPEICSLVETSGSEATLTAVRTGICTVTVIDAANDNHQYDLNFMPYLPDEG